MKIKLKLLLILFVTVVLMVSTVFATEPKATTVPTAEVNSTEGNVEGTETPAPLTEKDVIHSDKCYAGDNVEIYGIIDGNVFIIGKNVTIKEGTAIGGDIIIIANNFVTEKGIEIYGNAVILASEVNLNNAMYDAYITADKVEYGYYAYTQRDLRIMATEVNLNGEVARNTFIETDKLTIKDYITPGNLTYSATEEAIFRKVIENEETGETTIEETTEIPKETVKGDVTFTKRNNKILAKEMNKVVDKILKDNKINNDTSEEKIKAVILSYVLNAVGVNSNSEMLKDVPNPNKTMNIIKVVVTIIVIAAIIVLVVKNKEILGIGKKSNNENK